MRLDYFTGLGRTMGDMPFNIHENAIFGHPLSQNFSANVAPIRDPRNNSRVASVPDNHSAKDHSHSRMRKSFEQMKRWAIEDSYNRMGERMRRDKEAQLVDIYV